MQAWAEYVLKVKKERGLSFGQIARLTKTSYSFWHNQIYQVKGPPTLEQAKKLADVLEIDANKFINLVFRDRLLYHLEKEGLSNNHPTKEIRNLIKSLKNWSPEEGGDIRYIMSTIMEKLGTDFANKIKKIEFVEKGKLPRTLNGHLREASFPSEAETAQEGSFVDLDKDSE